MTKNVWLILGVLFLAYSCKQNEVSEQAEQAKEAVETFSFAFMTDIHLQPERNAVEGFHKAIDSVNRLSPDFVLTGGDLIMDALGQSQDRSDSLYKLYKESLESFNMPVYNTIGNHEVFGLYEKSGISPDHALYGKKMYEKYIDDRFHSFDYKGWHFMMLDGIGYTQDRHYMGMIDSIQMEWIKKDLAKIDTNTPVCITTHIPFISVFMQMEYGPFEVNGPGLVIGNFREVLALFEHHNLKLVLQGHLHYFEHIYVDGINFITGGAVCSKWWEGKNHGLEEGFLMFHIKGEEFDYEYIDYGWEVR